LNQLRSKIDSKGININEDISVYCGGGVRSRIAYSLMKNKGFKNVHNIPGGFAKLSKVGVKMTTNFVKEQHKCSLI